MRLIFGILLNYSEFQFLRFVPPYMSYQKQMAENLGITERNYQRYEATSNPSVKTLIKIADYFDVTIDYLLGRSDK